MQIKTAPAPTQERLISLNVNYNPIYCGQSIFFHKMWITIDLSTSIYKNLIGILDKTYGYDIISVISE